MMNESLLELALAAIDAPSLLPSLGDALATSGWWDERVNDVLRSAWPKALPLTADEAVTMLRAHYGSSAPALAAVLLFGAWPTERWPVNGSAEPKGVTLDRDAARLGIRRREGEADASLEDRIWLMLVPVLYASDEGLRERIRDRLLEQGTDEGELAILAGEALSTLGERLGVQRQRPPEG